MKALSFPATRSGKSVNLQAIIAAVRNTLTAQALTRFAIFCAVVVYLSLIFGSDMVMYIAGFLGILAIWAAESLPEKKGGAE